MTIQTAVIGSMASAGRNKGEAITLLIIALWVNIPMSVLNFAMVSLGLENQEDMYVLDDHRINQPLTLPSGISAGLLSTCRLTGGALASAVYSTIQLSRFGEVLPGKIESIARETEFSGSLSLLIAAAKLNTAAAYAKVPGITTAVVAAANTAVQDAYIDAFKLVYLVAIAFGSVAILIALITKPIDPAKKTNERAIRLENEVTKVITTNA